MRSPKRCKSCGYNYLAQARFGSAAVDDGQKQPEQKCPKCGETA